MKHHDKCPRGERLLKQRKANMKHQTSFFVITQNVIFGTLANI